VSGNPTVSPEMAIIFENVQHTTHLTEDENSRALLFHRLQQFVKNHHFATVVYNVFVRGVGRARLGTIKQVRMAGNLPQLHDHVHESCLPFLLARETYIVDKNISYAISRLHTINSIYIFLKNGSIPLPLHVSQANIDIDFLFCRAI
jgi:hypothetical protein